MPYFVMMKQAVYEGQGGNQMMKALRVAKTGVGEVGKGDEGFNALVTAINTIC